MDNTTTAIPELYRKEEIRNGKLFVSFIKYKFFRPIIPPLEIRLKLQLETETNSHKRHKLRTSLNRISEQKHKELQTHL